MHFSHLFTVVFVLLSDCAADLNMMLSCSSFYGFIQDFKIFTVKCFCFLIITVSTVFMQTHLIFAKFFISFIEFHPDWTVNIDTTDRNSFMPLSKAWFLTMLLFMKKLLTKFLWTSPLSNFIQIGQKMYKISAKFHSYP